jgi:hypothetical protein
VTGPQLPLPRRRRLARLWTVNPALVLTAIGLGAVLLTAGVGLVVDHRVISNAPGWLKPAKFAASFAIYAATLVWLLTFITGHRRLVRLLSWISALALLVEMALIAAAAALGTTSHFNVSTPLHGALWSTMATAISLIWLAGLVVAGLLLRQKLPDPTFAWSLRLGLLIALVGMAQAFLMTLPTTAQLTAAKSSGTFPVSGAHTVGIPDGGPGLPLLGWSTTAGDLRVGHFIGLHALQVLPLLGLALSHKESRWLSTRDRIALMVIIATTYLAVVALTTWQALRGQPLLKPDTLTWSALAALLLAALLAATTIVLRARTRASIPKVDQCGRGGRFDPAPEL